MIIGGRTARFIATAGTLALLSAGCDTSSSDQRSAPASTSAPTSPRVSTSAPAPDRIASADQLFVSIGDSYAAGYQPTARGKGSTTRNGFAYQAVTAAKAKGYNFSLVNFGCSGATTRSVLEKAGCAAKNLGPGAASYSPKTQAAAAQAFLRAHRGKVGLITVAVGGNDISSCSDAADATACVSATLGRVTTNLDILLKGLRAAAGPATRIVGITYPDVFLGEALSTSETKRNLANLSVFAFKSFINPALKTSYERVGGTFVDVTAATGAYGPLTTTTTLAPYGTVPVPVAKVCRLTYYCQFHDIHPRPNGYALIADLVIGTLPHH